MWPLRFPPSAPNHQTLRTVVLVPVSVRLKSEQKRPGAQDRQRDSASSSTDKSKAATDRSLIINQGPGPAHPASGHRVADRLKAAGAQAAGTLNKV